MVLLLLEFTSCRPLDTFWAVCYDAFERTRKKSKHISCYLEIQPDLRLAHSWASNPSQIPGEIRSFYSPQRKPDEKIWDKEERTLTSEVNDDELGPWASSLQTIGNFLPTLSVMEIMPHLDTVVQRSKWVCYFTHSTWDWVKAAEWWILEKNWGKYLGERSDKRE